MKMSECEIKTQQQNPPCRLKKKLLKHISSYRECECILQICCYC